LKGKLQDRQWRGGVRFTCVVDLKKRNSTTQREKKGENEGGKKGKPRNHLHKQKKTDKTGVALRDLKEEEITISHGTTPWNHPRKGKTGGPPSLKKITAVSKKKKRGVTKRTKVKRKEWGPATNVGWWQIGDLDQGGQKQRILWEKITYTQWVGDERSHNQ